MATNENTKKITIDLNRRVDVVQIGSDELIQQAARVKFDRLFDQAIKDAKSADCNPQADVGFGGIRDRRHNTVLFNGGRGSGKSTLLHNVLGSIQTSGKVQVLDVIDPTLIETKENILIILLGLIKQAVEARLDVLEKSGERRINRDNYDRSYQTQWREALRDLADGLTRLDNIGKDKPHDDWHDALYVMETGLQKADGSVRFERSFNAFLCWSLRILNKDLIVVAFDDIDVAFEKGWTVLEVIRKYLASPHLLVVVSGDLGLYSKLVRLQQWKNFNPDALKQDEKRRPEYERSVDELEDQYLMKVFKPSRRIDLLRLNNIVSGGTGSSSGHVVYVKSTNQEVELRIQDFLDQAIKQYFCVQDLDLPLYRSLILRQPVRSVVQFLQAFDEGENSDTSDTIVHNSIAEIVLGPLNRHGIVLDELILADAPDYFSLLREMLNRNQLWDAGYRLRPDLRDDDANLMILSLCARLTSAINRDPAMIFEYFIKVCLPHEAARYMPSIPGGDMNKYLRFVSRDLREDSLTEARQNVAVTVERARARRTQFSTTAGVVMVYGARTPNLNNVKTLIKDAGNDRGLNEFWSRMKGKEGTPKLGQTHNTWTQLQKRLTINKEETLMQRICCLLSCQIVDGYGQTSNYCSILNLLAAMGLLLKESQETTEKGQEPNAQDGFAGALKRYSQLRSYPIPNWGPVRGGQLIDRLDESVSDSDNDGMFDTDTNTSTSTPQDHQFIHVFGEWSRYLKQQFEMHPSSVYFFARVWSRFYSTLVTADTEIPLRDKFLGWMIHRYVIAFLNALLIEEIIERQPQNLSTSKFTLNNPTTDDRTFLSNLGIAMGLEAKPDPMTGNPDRLLIGRNKLRAELPVFAAFFGCPLLAPFLYPRSKMADKYGGLHLLDVQIAQWSEWLPIKSDQDGSQDVGSLLQVKYQGDDEVVTFKNLFDPLNSVLVIGRLRGDQSVDEG
jgi:hypothetical protein